MDILRKLDINVMAMDVASKIDRKDFYNSVMKPRQKTLNNVDEELYFIQAINELLAMEKKDINKYQDRLNFTGE